MKNKRNVSGIICCFLLFIVVCLFLVSNMKGVIHPPAHSETGLLLFMLPGVFGSIIVQRRHVIFPLVAAVLAAPLCYLLIRHFIIPTRPFWQMIAWLFSAIFWCEIGALGCIFIRHLFSHPGQSREEKHEKR